MTLLKALAKKNSNLFAIAFKSEKERQLAITLEREPSKKKQRTDTKKDARVITLQGAIVKNPILLSHIGNLNDWMAP